MEGGLGDADDGGAGEFAGGVQAGVAKAGDDVGVYAVAFAAQDFFADADGGDGVVEVAFDGFGAVGGVDGGEAGGWRGDALGGSRKYRLTSTPRG